MKRVLLERFAWTPFGTFGRLSVEDAFHCFTVEKVWANNEPRESCIPEGTYPLVLDRYLKGDYDAYEVKGVPQRSRILIHKANTADELAGCIAPGLSLGWVHERWAVASSGIAFEQFMQAMQREPGTLRVTHIETPGTYWRVA